MPRQTSLKTIVRDFPEPQKTEILERLQSESRAFVMTYKPGKDAPAWRRDGHSFEYGIPSRVVTFHANKPRAVDLGLAVFLLNQFQPRQHSMKDLCWGDEYHVQEDDPIVVDKLPDSARDAMEARAEATKKLEADQGKSFEDTDPDAGQKPLSGLNRQALVELYEEEIGVPPTPELFEDGKVTISNLLAAIRENRANPADDPSAPLE